MSQGGIFEALSFHKMWRAFKCDYQGSKKVVFSLKRPKSCLPVKHDVGIKINTKPKVSTKDWDFEISGYFPGKKCSIIDSQGNVVAQVQFILFRQFILKAMLEMRCMLISVSNNCRLEQIKRLGRSRVRISTMCQ